MKCKHEIIRSGATAIEDEMIRSGATIKFVAYCVQCGKHWEVEIREWNMRNEK